MPRKGEGGKEKGKGELKKKNSAIGESTLEEFNQIVRGA